MKFCRPVFRALKDVDLALARSTWEKHSSSFHPIARKMIEKVRCTYKGNDAADADAQRHGRILASLLEQSQAACTTHKLVQLNFIFRVP